MIILIKMVKFLIAFIFLYAALLVAASTLEEDERSHHVRKWNKFKRDHKKKNHTATEDAKRMKNFLRVDAMIEVHNSNPNATFQMDHNSFSDMHDHEKEAFLGAVPPPDYDRSINERVAERSLRQAVPSTLDLRDGPFKQCIGPVKNQRSCGSCWAFSAIAPLEYSYCKKHGGQNVSLSEQQLVDCAKTAGNGCQGGWPDNGWSYIQTNGGVEEDSVYPYTAKDGNCTFEISKVKANVSSHGKVGNQPILIQQALVSHGPLSIAMCVTGSFFTYKTGVYSDPTGQCKKLNNKINHGMTMVGYGKENKMDYWIVRNSWGKGWGKEGYIQIRRGINLCNIENYVYYVEAA